MTPLLGALLAGLWAPPTALPSAPPSGAAVPAGLVSRDREGLSKETALLDRIDAIDRLVLQLALRQYEHEERLAMQEARLKAINENLGTLADQIADRRTLIAQRLRTRARLDEAAYLRVLLAAHEPTEMVYRQVYLRRVLENDARLLRDLRQAEQTVATLTAEQDHVVGGIAADRAALARQREGLESERRSREAMLSGVRRERDLLRRLISAQVAAQAGLRFEGAASPDVRGFRAERGRLPIPAAGAIIQAFGEHEDAETGTRTFHKGVTINAHLGAPVRAVAQGTVAFAGWQRGFGNLVIVSHGEGFHTIYGHLSSTARLVGDTVAAGDVIGAVGDTGSLRGPVLYFELRREKRSLDPVEWFVRRH